MTELIIMRGVPASGKSTQALQWLAEASGRKRARVNRDDIRYQLFGKYWAVDENVVTLVQNLQLRALLKDHDVVLNNTSLKAEDVKSVLQIASECGADVTFIDCVVSLAAAIERDNRRAWEGGRHVGPSVIIGFFERFHIDKVTGELPAIPTLDSVVSMTFKPYIPDECLPREEAVDIEAEESIVN